jgi:hypothetical protein
MQSRDFSTHAHACIYTHGIIGSEHVEYDNIIMFANVASLLNIDKQYSAVDQSLTQPPSITAMGYFCDLISSFHQPIPSMSLLYLQLRIVS